MAGAGPCHGLLAPTLQVLGIHEALLPTISSVLLHGKDTGQLPIGVQRKLAAYLKAGIPPPSACCVGHMSCGGTAECGASNGGSTAATPRRQQQLRLLATLYPVSSVSRIKPVVVDSNVPRQSLWDAAALQQPTAAGEDDGWGAEDAPPSPLARAVSGRRGRQRRDQPAARQDPAPPPLCPVASAALVERSVEDAMEALLQAELHQAEQMVVELKARLGQQRERI